MLGSKPHFGIKTPLGPPPDQNPASAPGAAQGQVLPFSGKGPEARGPMDPVFKFFFLPEPSVFSRKFRIFQNQTPTQGVRGEFLGTGPFDQNPGPGENRNFGGATGSQPCVLYPGLALRVKSWVSAISTHRKLEKNPVLFPQKSHQEPLEIIIDQNEITWENCRNLGRRRRRTLSHKCMRPTKPQNCDLEAQTRTRTDFAI